MCLPLQVGCKVEEGAANALKDAIDNLANAVVEAFEKAVASLGTVWVYIGTPNLTETGGDSSIEAGTAPVAASENLETVLAYVTWIGLGVAVLALFALGAHMAAMSKRGNGEALVGRVGITMAAVALIAGASSLVAGFMPSGPEEAGGAVLFLQSSLWWFMGAAAILSILVAGVRMAWTQRAEPAKELVQSVLTLIVVAGASTTVIGLLVTVADTASVWIINGSLDCNIAEESSCFAGNITALLALTTVASPALGPLLIIILGLLAILTSLIQIVLMVARGGMLVILAGILPLSASFTNTEMGKQWFKRAIGWLIAFILYKPAAAIVYATAFQLTGTNVFQDDGSGMIAVLTGLVLMTLALFALPALMRFVTPMVSQTSGGGGGGGMAGAAAVAALPMGASAAGRLSGMVGGGGSDSASSSSAPSGSAETGSSGPSGDSAAGGQGPAGSSDSSAGARGPSGPGGATGDSGGAGSTGTGAAGADSAGAGAGTGAAGGGAGAGGAGAGAAAGGAGAAAGGAGAAAGGGAAAAGAAGGPVGIAAGAAVDAGTKAGKAAAGAAKSVGEEATGEEGGGPSGSR